MPSLVRHPDAPPGAIQAVEAELERVPGAAIVTFRAIGNIAQLVIPGPAARVRTDELWRTTCFELFVAGDGAEYREFNFSPSGAWAAYQFSDYRRGMRQADGKVDVEIVHDSKQLKLVAKIACEFANPARVGLTAVIEERDGEIRYWSTAFAPGRADFHAAEVRSLLFDGVSAE